MTNLFQVATPEGVVRDSSDVDDGSDSGDSSNGGDGSEDAAERARRAATRHCGWVPSTSNGVEASFLRVLYHAIMYDICTK